MVKGKLARRAFASSSDDACHRTFVGVWWHHRRHVLEFFHCGKIARLN
jgi:hypothetical protein